MLRTVVCGEELYFRSEPRFVPGAGGLTEQVAAKWNIHAGMKPITWILSDSLVKAAQDPRYKDSDLIGAMKRGVEVRASKQGAVRLQAWNIATEGIQAPLSPEVLAAEDLAARIDRATSPYFN